MRVPNNPWPRPPPPPKGRIEGERPSKDEAGMRLNGTTTKPTNKQSTIKNPCVDCEHYGIYTGSYDRTYAGCFRNSTLSGEFDPVTGKKRPEMVYGILDCQTERSDNRINPDICGFNGKFFKQKPIPPKKKTLVDWLKSICLEKP